MTSVDLGPLGFARGDVLMQEGIELSQTGASRARVLILQAQ